MKTTAEMIAVMQAFERLEVVQRRAISRANDGWATLIPGAGHQFNFNDYDYRIKPREPRVIWVNEYIDADMAYHTSEAMARECAMPNAKRIAIKFVEVIE